MELNSNAETEATNPQETSGEEKGLDAIIRESQQNIAADNGEKKSGRGRRPKYGSDEERRAARRAQDRAYKAARRTGDPAPGPGATIQMERIPSPDPQPAGLAPLLSQAVDVPVYQIRSHFNLTPEELPDLPKDAKEDFVAQADMVIGIFCPDAVNNKYVLLASLLGSAAVLYGSVFMKARSLAATKITEPKPVEGRPLTPQESGGFHFPPATIG